MRLCSVLYNYTGILGRRGIRKMPLNLNVIVIYMYLHVFVLKLVYPMYRVLLLFAITSSLNLVSKLVNLIVQNCVYNHYKYAKNGTFAN